MPLASCFLLSSHPFHCSSTIILRIVCEAPSCLASSAQVQTHSCVNLRSKTGYWIALEVHRKFAFRTVTFVTAQQLSYIFLNSLNSSLLLIFPTIVTSTNLFCNITKHTKQSYKIKLCDCGVQMFFPKRTLLVNSIL